MRKLLDNAIRFAGWIRYISTYILFTIISKLLELPRAIKDAVVGVAILGSAVVLINMHSVLLLEAASDIKQHMFLKKQKWKVYEVDPQVLKVFKRVKKSSGISSRVGTVIELDSPIVNAFVLKSGDIYLTTGILRAMKTEDELAAIIGHEIAHIMLGNTSGTRVRDNRHNEVNADAIGMYIAQKAGYSPCGAAEFWSRQYQSSGSDVYTVTHPSALQRVGYLSLPACFTESKNNKGDKQ